MGSNLSLPPAGITSPALTLWEGASASFHSALVAHLSFQVVTPHHLAPCLDPQALTPGRPEAQLLPGAFPRSRAQRGVQPRKPCPVQRGQPGASRQREKVRETGPPVPDGTGSTCCSFGPVWIHPAYGLEHRCPGIPQERVCSGVHCML